MRLFRQLLIPVLFLATVSAYGATDRTIDDPRLDKKITLSLGMVTLEEFAEEVSKQTGVTIVVGKNKKDWQVKERKTIVFAKDVPAKDIMIQVAELHHYTLSKFGEGDKRSYQYWQDAKSQKEEEALREGRDVIKGCIDALDEMAKLENAKGKMTAEQLAQLEKDDPYKHFLLTEPLGQARCGLAASILPYVKANPGDEWTMPVGPADPGLQVAIRRYLEELCKLATKKPGLTPDDLIRRYGTGIEFVPANKREGMREMGYYGELKIGGCTIMLTEPGSFRREEMVSVYKARRAGVDLADLANLETKWEPLEYTPLKDDPILRQTVKIEKEKARDYVAWLQAIHEKTGLTVLSDSYWERVYEEGSGDVLIKNLLEKMAPLGKGISKEDSTLILSNKYWYNMRPADIPDYYLEYYTKKAEISGLVLDDIKRIALDLNDIQITKNLLQRDAFEEHEDWLGAPEQLADLRFLAILKPEQKSLMSNGSSLPAEKFSTEALGYALQAIGKDMSYLQGMRATFYEYNERETEEGWQYISLKLDLVDGQDIDGQDITDSCEISIMLPTLLPKDTAK